MRHQFSETLEAGRLRAGYFASGSGDRYGAFEVQGPCGARLAIIASDGSGDNLISAGWEHVSVSIKHRPPNWQEMTFIKDLFWDDEETVIELHPPRSRWINNFSNCLHLWKPPYQVPLPPDILVGKQELGTLA